MGATYHHGSLRETLLDAGVELVAEAGIDALSLRELARRAGVSSAAPYRHFPDKDALLRGVAARGYQRFDQALGKVSKQCAETSALEAVQQLGVAYVRFAARNPNLFRLIFSPIGQASGHDPELDKACRQSAEHLPRALMRLHEEGIATSISVQELTELAWALVHGVAMLYLDGLVGDGKPLSAEKAAERVTQHLVALFRAD
ncbi:MAG: TetR/AcrR family transcriptional regulator [Polyangiaceae bacterium]|nr:TetR/AcrR family transcriptional regulator [Myxococcales bacterium]MCB9585781.1 TetR/AcrR family transcriptional regulator [Polyangiaceae bacterium]MCB9607290.1 TetR/AcrR family transcriptional regulator [Polyangiaceae bacterium]